LNSSFLESEPVSVPSIHRYLVQPVVEVLFIVPAGLCGFRNVPGHRRV
jgi:hypothetical protein